MRPVLELLRRARRPAHASLAFAALAAALAACTSTLASLPGIGEPAGLPPRPETPPPYLAVHDIPAPREAKPLTEADRKKLETDLIATRNRQAPASATAKKKATP